MLDFESVLKYFRVSMPKRYLDEAQCERLFNVAFSMKVCNAPFAGCHLLLVIG